MNSKTFLTLSLLFWSVLLCGQSLQHAQDSYADTLSAAGIVEFVKNTAAPVQVLSGKRLQSLASTSSADALRLFAGVQVKDFGGIGGLKTVNVRSLGSQHVAVFYNGVKIMNAQNGTVDLGRYSLDNLEEISVYNAQKSELLQSASDYSSAAAVYLKSKHPEFTEKNFNASIRLKGGSSGMKSSSIHLEKRFRRFDIGSELMYLHNDGDYRFHLKSSVEDTVGRRTNSDISAVRAEVSIYSSIKNGEFCGYLYHYSSDRGLPGPVVRRLSEQFKSTDRQIDENSFAQFSYRKSSDKTAWMMVFKASDDFLEYESIPSENAATLHIHNTYRQKDIYHSTSMAYYPLQWISFNAASDIRYSHLDTDVKNFSQVERIDWRVALASSQLWKKISLNESILMTAIHDNGDRARDSAIKDLSPTAIVNWKNQYFNARAFYKSILRAPTFNDLYYTNIGNPGLEPEVSRQIDMGISMKEHNQYPGVEADIYHNTVKNKIVAVPTNNQFRWSMMNLGKVEIYGLNIRIEKNWKPTDSIEFGSLVSYTFEKAMDYSEPESHYYKGQIPYTPEHSASVILNGSSKGWTVNMSFLYTGVRYSSSDNYAGSRLKAWNTTDLTISKEIKDARTIIAIEVDNLFNKRYEVVSRYPMPGTQVILSLRYNL